MNNAIFIGIDVGTQGVRVLLVDEEGNTIESSERKTDLTSDFRTAQNPDLWWDGVMACLDEVFQQLDPIKKKDIIAISVTSTSGTVIPLDNQNRPLNPAIMYSDMRQADEGKRCKEIAIRHRIEGYTAFNSSSGLPKMVWFVERFPEKARQISTWVHATDYMIGKLSGHFRISDHTNVLKSGYDLIHHRWPEYITSELPIEKEWLQEVVAPGTVIGYLNPDLRSRWNLPEIKVVAGMTDGCASQVASGGVKPGDWNTTIGTTLVVKGVTMKEIKDPQGRLYSHLHPQGYWMPGGASNTGADWVSQDFKGENLNFLNDQADHITPSGYLVYPLKQEGERFPFISPMARGFTDKRIQTREELYTAGLEGVAYLEKLSYEIIKELSGENIEAVYSSGGGNNSRTWMKIRASVLNLPIYQSSQASGALGAAIVAASQTFFSNLTEAATSMTNLEHCFEPEEELLAPYEEGYQSFIIELKNRGYLTI